MKNLLFAGLASALIPSLAGAQLVLTESGLGSPTSVYHYKLADASMTDVPSTMTFEDAAADEANRVLYLMRYGASCPGSGGQELWRWPYSDAAPTRVGCFVDADSGFEVTANGMTFGNGKLYLTTIGLCRSIIWEVDPASPGTAEIIWDPGHGAWISGIAYDSAADRLLACKTENQRGACYGNDVPGIYAINWLGAVETRIADLPPDPTQVGTATVGGGKMWFVSQGASSVIQSLDLTTLTWDPAPPPNPVPLGFAGQYGITWAPRLVLERNGHWRKISAAFSGIFNP